MRVIGDIGGTKALLGLIDGQAPAGTFVTSERMFCANYPDFTTLLSDFLAMTGVPAGSITGGCLAVAGPIDDDQHKARLTNLPWTINSGALARDLGIGSVRLINDFAAAALGTTAASPSDLVTLQHGEPVADGVRLVIGAGTGLGMATMVLDDGSWRVLPGEGGHCGFAPTDDSQCALWSHLKSTRARVEYEDVVSGPGLIASYRFFAGAHADTALLAAADPAAAISDAARRGTDPAANIAVETFLAAYGAFAGDMALALMARGGIYLAGGIAARLLPQMQSGTFMSAFNAKGGHSSLAKRMPVCVATDPDLGLRGAALHDRRN